MVMDNTNVQDGTLKSAGTCNASVEFDARNVGCIYDYFRTLVKTVRHYITSADANAYVQGFKDEKGNKALIRVVVDSSETLNLLQDPIIDIVKSCRNLAVAQGTVLQIDFITPANFGVLDSLVVKEE